MAALALGCAASSSVPVAAEPGCDASCQAERLCRARRGALPPRPFSTDGCSFFPDDGWRACCERHDMDYWCGGSLLERLRSDLALARCVGHGPVGILMFLGVRLGGSFLLPTPWRWGFGHPYPGGVTGCRHAPGDRAGALPEDVPLPGAAPPAGAGSAASGSAIRPLRTGGAGGDPR